MTAHASGQLFAYPRLSKWDLGAFRIGGPGLGNLLFIWARTIRFCHEHNAVPVWPTWPQLKVGPWLRGERDKRGYSTLFVPTARYVQGLRKARLLATLPHRQETGWQPSDSRGIVMFDGMGRGFEDLRGAEAVLHDEFMAICAQTPTDDTDFRTIRVHVRMGDFAAISPEALEQRDIPNARLPLEWYAEKITQVRESLGGCTDVEIFSDSGPEALGLLMELPNTRLCGGHSAVDDLISLARSGLLIGSNSTFSQWGRFLGGMPAVWYRASQSRWPFFKGTAGMDCESRLGEGLAPDWKLLAQERMTCRR